jgi:hypothetical protein
MTSAPMFVYDVVKLCKLYYVYNFSLIALKVKIQIN